jgi:hypothetical protein
VPPLPEEHRQKPALVAAATMTANPDAPLVPVPVDAPRGTNEKPKILFVAMADFISEAAAAPLSLPENLGLLARLYAQYGAGKPISFVGTTMAAEPARASMIDRVLTGSIKPAAGLDTREAAPVPPAAMRGPE